MKKMLSLAVVALLFLGCGESDEKSSSDAEIVESSNNIKTTTEFNLDFLEQPAILISGNTYISQNLKYSMYHDIYHSEIEIDDSISKVCKLTILNSTAAYDQYLGVSYWIDRKTYYDGDVVSINNATSTENASFIISWGSFSSNTGHLDFAVNCDGNEIIEAEETAIEELESNEDSYVWSDGDLTAIPTN
jgi:hypothetical protein